MIRRGKGAGFSKTGEMNKTEAEYALGLRAAGATFWYEPIRFRLAKEVSYAPDFMVMRDDGSIVFIEVKAAIRDKRTGRYRPFYRNEDRVKVHVAAETFPMFHFLVVSKVPKKGGGGWLESPIPAPRGGVSSDT